MGLNSNILVAEQAKTVAVIGGGFSGSVFALKLAAVRPGWTVLLVEARTHAGRGVAYGSCGAEHLLNVPVNRMEIGLQPSFANWLRGRPGLLAEALAESGGKLEDAFVPRQLFGDYVAQRLDEALSRSLPGIRRVQGMAAGLTGEPRRLTLTDGRTWPVDAVVLATGNLPSRLPFEAAVSDRIIDDPWQPGALHGLPPDSTLLLVGSGLTMVDAVLSLRARGHAGRLVSVSRHGLLPRSHEAGGSWPAFVDVAASPRETLRAIRANVRDAIERGVPWQRVFDAVRPVVASLWHGWSIGQRAQFLRHLRTIWEVHRHRMAGRIGARIDELLRRDILQVVPGRILAVDEHKDGIIVLVRPRGEKARTMNVDAIVNCTGPRVDLRGCEHALLRGLLAQGLARSDPLGLGLESEDGALRGAGNAVSDWLYALGPLTRPAWWEITAVPEINAQIDRLVHKVCGRQDDLATQLPAIFLDIGAGI